MAERTSQLTVDGSPASPAKRGEQSTENEDGPRFDGRLAYIVDFDIEAYRLLRILKTQLSQEEFQRRKNQLDLRTRHNLETALGERFQVELSQVDYQIMDGQLKSEEHDEPFLEILKRGQEYRQDRGSSDVERELAEVIGFERVQEVIATGDMKHGTRIIVISPRGGGDSVYQHNFFDVYQLQNVQNEDGPRFVTMTRYTSGLTHEEFLEAADQIDSFNNLKQDSIDCDFLKTPLVTYQETAEILTIMRPDDETITLKDYQELIEKVSPLSDAYIKAPSQRIFNAILNLADEIVGGSPIPAVKSSHTIDVESMINYFGSLPVRQVATGCGIQGGFMSMVNFSPFSVAEFGMTNSVFEDQYGPREIHCEECGATYVRDAGMLEGKCRFCSGTRGIVC